MALGMLRGRQVGFQSLRPGSAGHKAYEQRGTRGRAYVGARCRHGLAGGPAARCPSPWLGKGKAGREGSHAAAELQQPRTWLLHLCVRDSRGVNLPQCEPHRASALPIIGREESGPCYWDGDV